MGIELTTTAYQVLQSATSIRLRNDDLEYKNPFSKFLFSFAFKFALLLHSHLKYLKTNRIIPDPAGIPR